MTASITTPRRSSGRVAVPVVGTAAWLAIAAVLFSGFEGILVLLPLVLIAVGATAIAIVRFVRRRSSEKPSGALVAALVAPAIVLAAMTPLFAVAGFVPFAAFALAMAVETALLAWISSRA